MINRLVYDSNRLYYCSMLTHVEGNLISNIVFNEGFPLFSKQVIKLREYTLIKIK